MTHDDLRIGRDNEYRDSSLDQIEADFPYELVGVLSNSEHVDIPVDSLITDNNVTTPKQIVSQPERSSPRFYANQYRVHHAVCGHDADPSRVSDLEFALLCTIGATRHEGILQGELGRLTKQDKRSVPKRTDALQSKGYIEKVAAYVKGHKTSRILLRRFADARKTSDDADLPPRVDDLARQILTLLKENPMTTQDEVASQLSILDPTKRQVFNQIVQHLIRIGCLQRVKIAHAPDSSSADLKSTLRFKRALESTDYGITSNDIIDLNASLDGKIALMRANMEDEEGDDLENEVELNETESPDSQALKRPDWNPDRAPPNAVYDLATLSGDRGLTNAMFRQQINGVTVRRPAEALLARLSHEALNSHPSPNSDLALVRTTELHNGVSRFVHRTLENYTNMVDRGDLTWATTDGGTDYARSPQTDSANRSSNAQENGDLEGRHIFGHQSSIGEATIEEIAKTPGPEAAVLIRAGETTMSKDRTGTMVLTSEPGDTNDDPAHQFNTLQKSSCVVTLKLGTGSMVQGSEAFTDQAQTPTKLKSTPPAFPRGTQKFWSRMFRMKKLELDPANAKVKQNVLMTDPNCVKMFTDRPEGFDALLTRALNEKLPLPRSPANIDEAWMKNFKAYLERKSTGLFYVPSGYASLREEKFSCRIVIKSSRLNELDSRHPSYTAAVPPLPSPQAHTLSLYETSQGYHDDPHEHSSNNVAITPHVEHGNLVNASGVMPSRLSNEENDREILQSASPSRDTLVVTLKLPRSTWLPPTSTAQKDVYHASPSPDTLMPQQGRTQRQRRPTRKALESAQIHFSKAGDSATDTAYSSTSNASEPNVEALSPSSLNADPAFRLSRAIVGSHDTVDSSTDIIEPGQAGLADVSNMSSQTATSPVLHDNMVNGVSHPESMHPGDLENESREASTVRGSVTPSTTSRKAVPAVGTGQLTLLTGRKAVPYYRKFLTELVYMCGGVVPNDPSLLKRAMAPKAVEAYVESNMNIKLIKTSISALTQSGKLKVMQFVFQRNGFNYTKAILAIPSMQPSDPLFISMQSKISSLPADTDYVPPELEKEANRKAQGILRTADSPAPDIKTNSKVAISTRPRRERRESNIVSRGESIDVTGERITLETCPNTGFLTLKVPKIAQVRTDQLFTSKYFDLPAQPVIVDASDSGPVTIPTSSSQRRNAIRNSRRFSTATRKVQWRTPKCTPLPKSLRAILANDQRLHQIDHALNINPALESFERDVDFVAEWEQKNFDDLQEARPQEWNFINHLSFRKDFVVAGEEADLQFRLISFNGLGEEVETDPPEPESWSVFAAVVSKEAAKVKKAIRNKAKRKRATQDHFEDGRSDVEEGHSDFMSSDGEGPKKKRQRGPNHKWRRKPRIAGTDLDRRRQKRSFVKPRGIGLRDIPKALAHRITTAIVVVKVLAGGLDKYLDWKLVARLIPDEPESMLHSRWRTLSTRYNNDFDAMVQDLQTKYLDALANDRVPSVNYNDLSGTNWEGIFEWAVNSINADNKGATVIELPPNREEFLELVSVEVGEETSVRSLHNNSLQYTQATKEDFWCSMVAGTNADSLPLAYPRIIEPVFQTEQDELDIKLARARSWVFAAVMTPHQSFNPQRTHEKLRKLADNERECEQLIDATIRRLQNDKMVVTKDSTDAVIEATGNTLSGTYHWKLSTKFMDRFELNRHITSTMLKQAVRYKLDVLDPAFARGDVVTIPGDPYLADGVMVAIFNLMNAGMISLEPGNDITATRYGIDGGSEGYKTRSMDKKNLFFSVVLRPTSPYVRGDLAGLARYRTGVPRGDIDQEDGMGLIPIWFDINLSFRPDIWDMVVGAVVGLISCRPGVSTVELVRTLQYAVSKRDMDMIVGYLVGCGCVVRTRSGWETTEIWWFAVGCGQGNETVMDSGNGAGNGSTILQF